MSRTFGARVQRALPHTVATLAVATALVPPAPSWSPLARVPSAIALAMAVVIWLAHLDGARAKLAQAAADMTPRTILGCEVALSVALTSITSVGFGALLMPAVLLTTGGLIGALVGRTHWSTRAKVTTMIAVQALSWLVDRASTVGEDLAAPVWITAMGLSVVVLVVEVGLVFHEQHLLAMNADMVVAARAEHEARARRAQIAADRWARAERRRHNIAVRRAVLKGLR